MKPCKSLLRSALIGGVAGGLVVAAVVFAVLPRVVQLDERYTGLPADFRNVAQTAYAARPQAFAAGADKDHSRDNVRLWDAVRQVASPRKPLGADHWPGPQQTGDCVSMGMATAIVHTSASAAVAAGRRSIQDPFQPFLYSMARLIDGRPSPPCGSAGAYPTEAAEAFELFGWVTYAEAGVEYAGSLADKWGCKSPGERMMQLAHARSGGSWYPIRDLDEWQNAICSGFATTVAMPWSPSKPIVRDGRRVITRFGRGGGHQVAAIAFDGSPGRRYWCLFNSHGPAWPDGAAPMQGEPRGSVWISEDAAQWIIDNGVVIAISSTQDFKPLEIDWSAFDVVHLSQPHKEVQHARLSAPKPQAL